MVWRLAFGQNFAVLFAVTARLFSTHFLRRLPAHHEAYFGGHIKRSDRKSMHKVRHSKTI